MRSRPAPPRAAASTGTALCGARLFGDDVLKGRPAQYREDRVVQREKRQVAARSGEMLAPTPPTTSGIASGRKRSGRTSSRVRLAAAIAASSVPTAQMPDVREGDAGERRPLERPKKSANAGRATSSTAARKTNDGDRLAEPDRAAVAGREHEPVERAALALGHPRPREPEQRGEDERHPEQAVRRASSAPSGSAKWKTTSVETTKSSIAGSVSRARSSSRRSLRASAATSAR